LDQWNALSVGRTLTNLMPNNYKSEIKASGSYTKDWCTRTGQAPDQCLFWFIWLKCNFLSIQLQQKASFVTTSLSSLLFKTVTFVHLF